MAEKRLINANALTELEALEPIECDGTPMYRTGDVWDCIDAAPTVDAVEVIRCRDCKWYGSSYPAKIPPSCRNVNGLVCAEPMDFCCRAERRENDGER